MIIRTFETGDELAQVGIYNEVGADLPRFKPATVDEIRRRCNAPDFDPSARFYAVEAGRVVGYATFQANGRISYPWCRKGHQSAADPLLEQVLQALKARGAKRAFAAYRGDWPIQRDFFLQRGFAQVREMVNFVIDLVDMPTPAARALGSVTSLERADVPAVLALGSGVLQLHTVPELEKYLFDNPYFSAESLFALRNRQGDPVAVGIIVSNPNYSHPRQVDTAMPCFRLGAFGTEGMTTKRLNGLFSFLAANNRDVLPLALDLLSYTALRLEDTSVSTLGAQVPSDAPHLLHFYKQHFTRQGSFPIFERPL
jgi:hypothetical protein